MLWRVTVQQANGFSPQNLQAQVGDALFWYNADTDTTHQPVSTDANAKWSIPPITGGNSSDQLDLDQAGTVNYKCACANHDHAGSIIVASAIGIAYGATPLFPNSTAIAAGQCVSWSNSDAEPHQPCPDSGDPWFQAPIASGDISATVSFKSPGVNAYHCAVHPDNENEKGVITVGP
jgi:plastocyanin